LWGEEGFVPSLKNTLPGKKKKKDEMVPQQPELNSQGGKGDRSSGGRKILLLKGEGGKKG